MVSVFGNDIVVTCEHRSIFFVIVRAFGFDFVYGVYSRMVFENWFRLIHWLSHNRLSTFREFWNFGGKFYKYIFSLNTMNRNNKIAIDLKPFLQSPVPTSPVTNNSKLVEHILIDNSSLNYVIGISCESLRTKHIFFFILHKCILIYNYYIYIYI